MIVSSINELSGYEKDGSFTTSKNSQWQMFDAGVSAQTFCLAAFEYGLGTVIMGIFDDKKISDIIDLPENETVSVLIAIGVPRIIPPAPARLEPEELVRFK